MKTSRNLRLEHSVGPEKFLREILAAWAQEKRPCKETNKRTRKQNENESNKEEHRIGQMRAHKQGHKEQTHKDDEREINDANKIQQKYKNKTNCRRKKKWEERQQQEHICKDNKTNKYELPKRKEDHAEGTRTRAWNTALAGNIANASGRR